MNSVLALRFEIARRPASKRVSVEQLTASIPGIGVLNATALTAAGGTGETVARGRNFAAWVGLVPRQVSTGGKPRLLGLTEESMGQRLLAEFAKRHAGGTVAGQASDMASLTNVLAGGFTGAAIRPGIPERQWRGAKRAGP